MESGQLVSANIRLVRRLGDGAMGHVWLADHLALRTQVAVKFMNAETAADPSLSTRFAREAIAAAQIKSRHVVQILDHGLAESGQPYIVMELLQGEDLALHIVRRGHLSLAETATIVTQACKALAKAHSIGIIHRDIKPANLFLVAEDDDIFVKIVDFGIAKQQSDKAMSVTSTHEVVGTPLYMSPEQLLSLKRVDHRADLWALSVVAYYALTGNEPFQGETIGALSVAIHRGEFPLPSRVRPDLPLAVDAWFQRALNRDIDARFSSAEEMALEIDVIARGEASATFDVARTSHPASSALGPPTFSGTAMSGKRALPQRASRIAAGAVIAILTAVGVVALVRGPERPEVKTAAPLITSPSLPTPEVTPAPTSLPREHQIASASADPNSAPLIVPSVIASAVPQEGPAKHSETATKLSATPEIQTASPSPKPPLSSTTIQLKRRDLGF